MRPRIEKRYVFVGSVAAGSIERLERITQLARDAILKSGIEKLGLRGAAGRLGRRFFTLAGDERFNASMREVGRENIEEGLRLHIAEEIENDASGS